MRKLAGFIVLCLVTASSFCQSISKYQVATILEVKPHSGAEAHASGIDGYDVSVKVDGIIYVVLYVPQPGQADAKYAAGRDLLVQVGKRTISYNDILGRSYEVPIESQRPATASAGVGLP